MVLSLRRTGACNALRWQSDAATYRCGAMTEPEAVLRAAFTPWLRWLAPMLAPLLSMLAHRWIAAGKGCDSELEVTPSTESDGQSSS